MFFVQHLIDGVILAVDLLTLQSNLPQFFINFHLTIIVTTSESWIPLICYDFHGSESNNMNGSILKGFWVSNICRI